MLEILNEEEFNNFASKNENSIFFQSSYWGELKKTNGWGYYLVGYRKDNELLAATILLYKKIPVFKKYIFYIPRGFLIDFKNLDLVKIFTEEIYKFIKSKKGIFFKINPLISYQERDINGDIVKDGINNKELVKYLKKIGYKHVGFTIDYGKDLEPRWISVLDLKNKSEEEVYKNFRDSHKRKIKKSMSGYLTLEEANTEDKICEYKKILKHTGERRGFIDRPLSYYNAMWKIFGNNIKIILVKLNLKKYIDNLNIELEKTNEKIKNLSDKKDKEKKDLEMKKAVIEKNLEKANENRKQDGDEVYITAGLFMLFGNQLVYLFGGSYQKYMSYQGAYFMQWEMIKYAINNKYDKYNFYGITGHFEEDSPMYGLFDFKRGFGANVVELIGEFTMVTNKVYYNIYRFMFFIYKKLKKIIKKV